MSKLTEKKARFLYGKIILYPSLVGFNVDYFYELCTRFLSDDFGLTEQEKKELNSKYEEIVEKMKNY